MESVLIAALLAATPATPANPATLATDPAAFDRQCFALMAEIVEDEDPRLRAVARVGAPYFLGRIDAAGSGPDEEDLAADLPQGGEREDLFLACGDAMLSGGHDFEDLGDALIPPALPAA